MYMKNKIYYENLKYSNKKIINKFKKKINFFLKSGSYILSKNVEIFERKFSRYIGAKFCVGVGNGLDALTIALKSLDLKNDSEVLVAANAYIACIFSILNAGLKPVLVEPNIETYNLDPQKVLKKINNKTKVILSVNLYGKACDLLSLKKICKKYNLFLIEDCAQSHGAKIHKKKTGNFGDIGCFSFYPTKNLGAIGDAGAITTNNKLIYHRIKKLRNYGSIYRYKNELIGVNSRLDEIQAVFLNCKLNFLEKINKKKRYFASLYNKYLSNKYIKPKINKNFYDVFYVYNIRHNKRDYIKKILFKNNIETDIHYPVPPYRQKCLKQIFKKKKFPISDLIHKTTLSLPLSYSHTKKDIFKVIRTLNNIKL